MPEDEPIVAEEPTDIARIMDMDPLEHTDKDIDAIIATMRKGRAAFNLTGNKKSGSKKSLSPAKQEELSLASALKVEVDDI